MNTGARAAAAGERQRPVDGDDAAERADRIAGVGPLVRRGDVVGDGDAARVGVLDDHARRLGEAVDEPPRRLGVVQVEVAQRLAAVLLRRVPPPRPPTLAVAGGELVRVLAVAQVLDALEPQRQRVGGSGPSPVGLSSPSSQATISASYAAVRANASRARRRRVSRGQPTVGAQLVEHRLVVGRVDDDADVGVVLRRRPHHRRPADVDQLDAGIVGERVQVDDDEGDRLDAVLLEVAPVVGVVEVGEDAAVHLRVQGDDAVAEDRRQAGELGDVGDRQPGVGDRPAVPPLDTSRQPSSWSPRASSTIPALS